MIEKVIIITGGSKQGKITLANKIADDYGYSIISTDDYYMQGKGSGVSYEILGKDLEEKRKFYTQYKGKIIIEGSGLWNNDEVKLIKKYLGVEDIEIFLLDTEKGWDRYLDNYCPRFKNKKHSAKFYFNYRINFEKLKDKVKVISNYEDIKKYL